MTMPGFITGQPISGQQAGNGVFQLLPSLPHESPVPMPRFLARALFPGGFVPGRLPAQVQAAPMAPPVVQPPVIQPPVIQPPAPAVNQVVNTRAAAQPAQPNPNPAPAGFRPIREGGNPIGVSSRRIRIVERKGL